MGPVDYSHEYEEEWLYDLRWWEGLALVVGLVVLAVVCLCLAPYVLWVDWWRESSAGWSREKKTLEREGGGE